jgi:hypothetical protein
MAGPAAGDHEPLTNSRPGDCAHHGHLLSAAHIQAQDRIAVFIILKYHGADGTLEDLQFLIQVASLLFQACFPPFSPAISGHILNIVHDEQKKEKPQMEITLGFSC